MKTPTKKEILHQLEQARKEGLNPKNWVSYDQHKKLSKKIREGLVKKSRQHAKDEHQKEIEAYAQTRAKATI